MSDFCYYLLLFTSVCFPECDHHKNDESEGRTVKYSRKPNYPVHVLSVTGIDAHCSCADYMLLMGKLHICTTQDVCSVKMSYRM